MATHSSILAWRIHGRYGPCGSPRVGHDAITSWEIDGETVETVSDFIFGAPKSLQMVIAAMKLKDHTDFNYIAKVNTIIFFLTIIFKTCFTMVVQDWVLS